MSAGLNKPLAILKTLFFASQNTILKRLVEPQAKFTKSIEQLCVFPNRGRIGREAGTRELVLSPLRYIVTYKVAEATVLILHIWHGARDWR